MHSSRLLQNQMLTDFTKSFDPSGKTGAWCHHRGAWDGQAPAQPIEQRPRLRHGPAPGLKHRRRRLSSLAADARCRSTSTDPAARDRRVMPAC